MRNKFIIFTIFALGILKTSAQSDFRSGYIVKNNNDTLYGLIDYRGNKANARACVFKQNKKAKADTFLPDQITAYRFTDSKFYVSKPVNTGEKEEQIFLEYLINGVVSIYYYRDIKGEHYFIEKEKGQLVNLKSESKEVIIDAINYIRETKEYIGVLNYMLKESPALRSDIEKTNLNHKSLIKLASDYHTQMCSDKSCIIYEKKEVKIKFEFGPLIGYNVETIDMDFNKQNDWSAFNNSNLSMLNLPAFGFFAKSNIPFISERLFIQYEGTFSKLNSDIRINIYSNIFEEYSISREYNQSIMFRYEFPVGKVRPVFQIGIFENIYMNESTCRTTTHFVDGSKYISSIAQISPSYLSDYGYSLGVGLITKILNRNLYLDLKYQPNISYGSGMNSLSNLKSSTFSVNLSMSLLK